MTTSKGSGKGKKEAAAGAPAERVVICGEKLTIETIGDFAREVQQAIGEAETVVVEFPETVEVDVTALQLFCSACTTATSSGKRFIHRGTLPQALLALAAAAGSERKEHCKNNNTACFRKFGGMV